MKKRALMALPNLTATDEMKKIATSDLPRKEKTDYGYVREVCEYYTYLRCIKQDGILKVAFFLPEHLRLNGSNPAYEVYLDKEKRQFITYNSLTQKWCESKLDRLDWKQLYWYAKTSWVSEEDMTAVQTYLGSDKKAVDAILQFQRDVRDEQLEQRHRRETDPWDKDMEQVPELPKDWSRWVDKVAIQQNYIYYHYKKGGAKTGYCTYCEKEVPIKVHPHHNQQGRCSCCRHPVVFKAYESSGKGENGEDRIIKTLYCDNPDCETRRLKKFVHFVSQKAMDIEGLSEATLEKFIGQGFIHSYLDIYRLDRYRAEIVRMDGFGEKSWQRLWDAIQQSRNTTFERYLISMDIPMIGNTASKVLGRVFHYDLDEFRDAVYGGYDFRQLPDFGETLHNNIHDWFCVEDNFCIWEELQTMMNIQKPAVAEHSEDRGQDNPFVGKTIVVTGKVEPYTRDGINDLIESLGAHAGSSVSKKTDYLVCGENAGSKLSKARDLGVTVLSPAEFFSMAGAE